jgi:hypothetical protein
VIIIPPPTGAKMRCCWSVPCESAPRCHAGGNGADAGVAFKGSSAPGPLGRG